MKRIFSVYMIFTQLFFTSYVYSESIWKGGNIYLSEGNLNVGDIVVVKINDVSQLKFSMSLESDNSINIVSNPDTNITGFLPKVSSDKKIDSGDNTNFSGTGNLKVSIAARITNRLRDGKYRINGTRSYSLNGIINRFNVSGIIDPALVSGRSVMSKDIADFNLSIRGSKEVSGIDIKRGELEEGESAELKLTEEEKQTIILDYLNKMLRELNR